jgi:hypothetical protein
MTLRSDAPHTERTGVGEFTGSVVSIESDELIAFVLGAILIMLGIIAG